MQCNAPFLLEYMTFPWLSHHPLLEMHSFPQEYRSLLALIAVLHCFHLSSRHCPRDCRSVHCLYGACCVSCRKPPTELARVSLGRSSTILLPVSLQLRCCMIPPSPTGNGEESIPMLMFNHSDKEDSLRNRPHSNPENGRQQRCGDPYTPSKLPDTKSSTGW